MHLRTQLLDAVVRGDQRAEQLQLLRVEVSGESSDAVLGDVDVGELGAPAQPLRQHLQAVTA